MPRVTMFPVSQPAYPIDSAFKRATFRTTTRQVKAEEAASNRAVAAPTPVTAATERKKSGRRLDVLESSPSTTHRNHAR